MILLEFLYVYLIRWSVNDYATSVVHSKLRQDARISITIDDHPSRVDTATKIYKNIANYVFHVHI